MMSSTALPEHPQAATAAGMLCIPVFAELHLCDLASDTVCRLCATVFATFQACKAVDV